MVENYIKFSIKEGIALLFNSTLELFFADLHHDHNSPS